MSVLIVPPSETCCLISGAIMIILGCKGCFPFRAVMWWSPPARNSSIGAEVVMVGCFRYLGCAGSFVFHQLRFYSLFILSLLSLDVKKYNGIVLCPVRIYHWSYPYTWRNFTA